VKPAAYPTYTYSDYLTWPDEERCEIIDGIAFSMTPAPGIKHQNVVVVFARIIGNELEGKPCRLFVAATDVVLSEHDVVQSDVLVERFFLKGKRYSEPEIFGTQEELSLKSLEGLDIALWEVFEVEAPGASDQERRPGEGG
jgi:hypothetical protein